MKNLLLLISLFIIVECGQSELEKIIETNEKVYSESFSNMKIELLRMI